MLGSVLLASVFSCAERPADGVQPRGAGSAALYLSATAAEQWYRA